MDFTTAYFFRGILPGARRIHLAAVRRRRRDLSMNAADDDFIGNLVFNVGSWNSIQSEQTLASGFGPANWYESDVTTGFSLALAKYLTANVSYIAYTYPNGAFPTRPGALDGGLAFNDSELSARFSLPAVETWPSRFDNTGLRPERGHLPPARGEAERRPCSRTRESFPLTLALPLTLGLSVSDYYEEGPGGDNDTFGYFDGVASRRQRCPLAFIPSDYGACERERRASTSWP
jgi:hypothetical protein